MAVRVQPYDRAVRRALTAASPTGNAFTIRKDNRGAVSHTCTRPGIANCPTSGIW